ncbi:oligosaccharide flippase family protein [Symbiobacterium thermophilum]|uniref:Polysaccharide biosynthesis protein n=1 Tax=Symbiobacterium thermophilum TaxID=2734 RepID=A0A953LK50_SYMTR|nr:oligosaccharide flippase family protein [Symbiobacterium thermophilum]MBY6276607.1 polysaccharide biosynthesis protein [Symbiobacterium thermophilum]
MLLRHSAAYLLARGLPALVNFLAIALYSRLLTPDEYGTYAVVVAWVSLGNAVFFQWLRLGVLRFLPSSGEHREQLLSTVALGFVTQVLLTATVCLVLWFHQGSQERGLVLVGLVLLWLQAWFELNLELARAELNPVRYGLLSFLKSALGLIVGAGLVFFGFGVEGVLIGVIVSNLLPGLWSAFASWTRVRLYLVDRKALLELVRYGLPLTVTLALAYVVSTSDRLLLDWLRGPSEAGLYAVGYDLAQSTSGVLMMVINLAAYPVVVKTLETQGVEAAREQLCNSATILLSVAVPATAGLMLLSANIADAFVGEAFRVEAAAIIPWAALGALISGVKAYHIDLGFQLGKRTLTQVWSVLGAAISNLVLNVLLIPNYGALGAASSAVIAYGVGLAISWGLVKQVFPMPFPVADGLKITLATAGMVLALLPLLRFRGLWALAGQITLGATAYGIFVVLLNVAGVRHQLSNLLQARKLLERRYGLQNPPRRSE